MPTFDPYAVVADELAEGQMDRALWVRSFAESGGEDGRAKAIYIQHRAGRVAAAFEAASEVARQEAQRAEQARVAQEKEEHRQAMQWQAEHDHEQSLRSVSVVLAVLFALFAVGLLLSQCVFAGQK